MKFNEIQIQSLQILSKEASKRLDKINQNGEQHTINLALNVVSSILKDEIGEYELSTKRRFFKQKGQIFLNTDGRKIDETLLKTLIERFGIISKTKPIVINPQDASHNTFETTYSIPNSSKSIQKLKDGIESLLTEAKGKSK